MGIKCVIFYVLLVIFSPNVSLAIMKFLDEWVSDKNYCLKLLISVPEHTLESAMIERVVTFDFRQLGWTAVFVKGLITSQISSTRFLS